MNVKNFLLNEHEEKCKIKEIFCEFCKKKLIRKNYFEHINNFCIERIKKCDLWEFIREIEKNGLWGVSDVKWIR